MSVDIQPYELSFRRPFTVEVARTLTIKNTNSHPIVFKVKTTAPKQYCVRPNAGRIEAGQEDSVTVRLQAMKADPPPETRCRDKFLVQSVAVTPDKEFASISAVLEGTEKSQIQEKKIRVNWMNQHEEFDGVASASAPSAPATETPRKSNAALNGDTDTPGATHFSSPGGETPSSSPPAYTNDENETTSKSTVSTAATAVAKTAQSTYEELKAQLVAAENQIIALKDQGLRQRSVKSSDEKESAAPKLAQTAKPQPVSGVSVPIVAFLCLLSFLLAYFFF